MKKLLILFTLLFLISCDKATTTASITTEESEITTAYGTTQNNLTTTTENTLTSTTVTTAATTEFTTIEAESSLKTETLPIYSSYYGNTNGNANNMGLVVYDSLSKIHIYAVGANVYTYDQMLDETKLLFTLSDGGYVRNMCLSDTYLYFVSTKDLYMMKYDFETEEITTVSEAETYFISRYDTYVYVDMVDQVYFIRGINVYSHNTDSFLSSYGSGVLNLNISGTKVFYNQTGGTNILVAGSTFTGKTTDVNLDEYNFVEIEELHLIKDSYSTGRTYAFIASTTSETALYLYNANTGLEKLVSSNGLDSLNSDTYNLFYINSGAIYKYNLDSQETTKIVNVDVSTKYIYVVNYWIYYSNDSLSSLYRIDPDTLEVETLN